MGLLESFKNHFLKPKQPVNQKQTILDTKSGPDFSPFAKVSPIPQSVKVPPVPQSFRVEKFKEAPLSHGQAATIAKVIFLNVLSKKADPIKKASDYPNYLAYDYGISNPIKYHKQMIDDGYLEPASFSAALQAYKVPQLKDIAHSLGLSKSGKKDELVQKIVDNATEELKAKVMNESQRYQLSKKGRDFLQENREYVLLHKHQNWEISVEEYIRVKKSLSFAPQFYDVCWAIFQQRYEDYTLSHRYGFARNIALYRAELLLEEKDYTRALEYYLVVLFYDCSGVDYYPLYQEKEITNLFWFAPVIIGMIEALKEHYSDNLIDRIFDNYSLPIQICSKEEFTQLVYKIMYEPFDEDEQIKAVDKLFENFKRFYSQWSRRGS